MCWLIVTLKYLVWTTYVPSLLIHLNIASQMEFNTSNCECLYTGVSKKIILSNAVPFSYLPTLLKNSDHIEGISKFNHLIQKNIICI